MMNAPSGFALADNASIASAAYNAAADSFDDPALGFWNYCGHRTVELTRLRRGSVVLDVGCGTGASALRAAHVVGTRGRVVGIDLSEGLLCQARAKARAQELHNVEFRAANMTELSYPESEFDAIIAVFSIFFVPDMARQVGELWRLVRPGGSLMITTWGQGLFEPASSLFWSAVQQVRPDLERRFNPWDHVSDVASVNGLFAAAGLPVPEIRAEQAVQRLLSHADWWTIARGTGFRWTIDQLTTEEESYVRAKNLAGLRDSGCKSIRTDFICAAARKSAPPSSVMSQRTKRH
jgi:ubiquinone/menaquinone biosynthesis C-methylase UbiE